MKATKYVLILLILIAITSCCFGADKPAAKEKTDQQIVVEGNNRFSLELYAKLRAKEGNLFFSPYSISTALAMAYAGARGETEEQMAETLHFPITIRTDDSKAVPFRERFHCAFAAIIKDLNTRGQKSAYELTVANALWGQKGYGFLKEFLDTIKAHYDGQLNEVDFVTATETARKTINTWVEKETKDKIKNLIPPGALNSLTRLVLTNAIYFKGNWARQFKKEQTSKAHFWPKGIRKNKLPPLVDMMNQTAEFKYMEAEDFQALELPYVDNELSMIILLPKEFDGLNKFEKKLTQENLSNWLARLRKRKVIVFIPKFKMTSQFGLAGVLKSMGMTDAFSSYKADFSGMNGKKDLFISAVIHKAYVDVNEEGTEAAAATGVIMKTVSIEPPPPVFRADHPFLFLIRDNHSGSILFIGRMTSPNAKR